MKNKASKFPLPKPTELATLAAILRPQSKPASAMKVAMEFYVEAVLFREECSSMSFEDTVGKFGSEKRWLGLHVEQIETARQAQWEDTLVLDTSKVTDPARDYLAECGWPLKSQWGVLDNIRKMWNARPQGTLTAQYRMSADALIAQCKTVLNDKTIHKIPRFVLEFTADYAKQHRKETKLKSRDACINRDAALKKSVK